MNLTCPACSTTFAIDGSKLGLAGKKVRCAQCQHMWHAEPDTEYVENERKKQEVLEAQRHDAAKALQEKLVAEKKPAPSAPVKEEKPAGSGKLTGFMKIAASVLLLLNIGAFITFNKGIIGQTGFYDMIGQYDTKALSIDPNSSVINKHPAKGTDVVVNWSIHNTSGKSAVNPAVRLKLYDAKMQEIGRKSNDANTKGIAAGGQVKFSDSLIHKTKTGRYLTVEFGNNSELATR